MTFFNIFSKKKDENRPLEKHKIIIDNREKNSLVASELVKNGLKIEFQQLAVADYLVNDVALERKTIADLKSSIINKRIMQQLPELKQYPRYALILEGFNENSYGGIIHENALRGFLLAIAFDYQVPVIYTLDEEDTARYISLLAGRSPKAESSLRAAKIIRTSDEQLQYILEGFPGIGPVAAKETPEPFPYLEGNSKRHRRRNQESNRQKSRNSFQDFKSSL